MIHFTQKRESTHPLLLVFLALNAVGFAGCGGSDFEVAPVTGIVKCDGKTVKGGLVYFVPRQLGDSAIVGKTGLGVIDQQGNFTVTTYEDADGAVVGKHLIKVDRGSGPGCDCAMNSERTVMEVEVTPGVENSFEILLPKKTRSDVRAAKAEAEKEGDDDDSEIADF